MYRFVEIFGERIGLFSVCVGIGLLCIVFLNMRQLKLFKADLDFENKILVSTPWAMLFGVVCGSLLDAGLRGGWAGLLTPWKYGLTFYGWMLGCMAFLIIYAVKVKIRPVFFLNLFLPGIALAQGFGRIGCFLGGCCYGQPSNFCAVVYPEGSFPYQEYGATPLFAVQLFESAWLFLIFAVLWFFVRFRYRGAFYLLLAPIGRIVLEFFRADPRGGIESAVLSPSQIIGIFLMICGTGLLIYQLRRTRKCRQNVAALLHK